MKQIKAKYYLNFCHFSVHGAIKALKETYLKPHVEADG